MVIRQHRLLGVVLASVAVLVASAVPAAAVDTSRPTPAVTNRWAFVVDRHPHRPDRHSCRRRHRQLGRGHQHHRPRVAWRLRSDPGRHGRGGRHRPRHRRWVPRRGCAPSRAGTPIRPTRTSVWRASTSMAIRPMRSLASTVPPFQLRLHPAGVPVGRRSQPHELHTRPQLPAQPHRRLRQHHPSPRPRRLRGPLPGLTGFPGHNKGVTAITAYSNVPASCREADRSIAGGEQLVHVLCSRRNGTPLDTPLT